MDPSYDTLHTASLQSKLRIRIADLLSQHLENQRQQTSNLKEMLSLRVAKG